MSDRNRLARSETEPTERMVQAGAKVIRSFDPRTADAEDLVLWVYQAMAEAQRKPKSC